MMAELALALLTVHSVDGRELHLAPHQITAMFEPRDMVHPSARCLVYLTDGKFHTVIEPCADIKRLIDGGK